MNGKFGILVVLAAVSCVAAAETVTLAPAAGVTTNALQLFTGDTAVEIAGPGTVTLNPANSHTGGTTLSGGTLELSGNIAAGDHSPVGAGRPASVPFQYRELYPAVTALFSATKQTIAPSSSCR